MIKSLFRKIKNNKKGNVVQLIIFAPFLMILMIFVAIEITCNLEANNLSNDVATLMRQIAKADSYQTALTIIDNSVGSGKVLRNDTEKETFISSLYIYQPYEFDNSIIMGNPINLGSTSINVSSYWKNGNIIETTFNRQLIDSSVSEIQISTYSFSLFKNSVSIHRRVMIEGSTVNNEAVI